MNLYNKKAKCPKCGNGDIGSGYHGSPCSRYDCPGKWQSPAHIIRHCKNCSYEWLEAPLDAEMVEHVKNCIEGCPACVMIAQSRRF